MGWSISQIYRVELRISIHSAVYDKNLGYSPITVDLPYTKFMEIENIM